MCVFNDSLPISSLKDNSDFFQPGPYEWLLWLSLTCSIVMLTLHSCTLSDKNKLRVCEQN